MHTHCDILIVGAGFVGVCAALHARAQNPEHRIILLDAGFAGGATVQRSSAMFLSFGASAEVRAMTAQSAAFYQAQTGFSSQFWEAHPFYWVSHADDTALMEERLLNPVTPLDHGTPCPVAAQFPNFARSDEMRLYHDNTVYRARPAALHEVLLSQALASERVALHEGVCVTALGRRADGGLTVGTPFGEFCAGRVVVCVAGAVQSPVFAPFFKDAATRAKKIVSFFIPFDDFDSTPVGVGFLRDEVYVMPEPDKSRWILSVTSEDWDVDILNRRPDFTETELADARVLARDTLGLAPHRLLGASVYADAYTPERRPRVLRPDGFDGRLTLATGTSGYGMKVGPAVALAALNREEMETA